MRVVMAGASGLIGTALRTSLLADGHHVITLVRRTPRADEQRWDPAGGRLDTDVLIGADAVVCLSGAGVGDRRWTPAYKRTLLHSRVDSVATLARAVAEREHPPAFVTASAIGYYGDGGERELHETSPPGDDFLAAMCVQWEAAARAARTAGARTVALRSGLVLSRAGGLLAQLRTVARLGLAGRLGTGRQFMPWISLADEIAAIRFLLDSSVEGPVNLVGPAPVRNTEFMAAVRRAVHRPAAPPVPGFALRIVLGEVAASTLTGQRAVPEVLTDAGFRFAHTSLDAALASELLP